MTDRLDGIWFEQTDVVTNTSPIEIDLLLPVADPHDLSQGSMLFGKVLELVIIEIAPESRSGQHGDVPIVEPLSSAVTSRVLVDIVGNKFENLITQRWLRIDVLQTG